MVLEILRQGDIIHLVWVGMGFGMLELVAGLSLVRVFCFNPWPSHKGNLVINGNQNRCLDAL